MLYSVYADWPRYWSINVEEIDWSKAPEGATHYQIKGINRSACWIKKDDCGRLECILDDGVDDRWDYAGSYKSKLHLLIARPQPIPWSGQCLPPVGAVCEMHHESWDTNTWPMVTVKYASTEYFITEDGAGEQHWHAHSVTFRAIRTPEQIAKDEREAAIDQIMDNLSLSPECRYIAKRVFDAGYRKEKKQ